MAGASDEGAGGGPGARRGGGMLPARGGCAVPGGGAGGRHPVDEGLEGHRSTRAVRGRAQALSHALRGAVMSSVAPGTRVDVDADLVADLRAEAPEAAERLVAGHRGRAYRLARRITGVNVD